MTHLKRWLTGIVGVPLITGVLFYGTEELFSLLVILLILLATAEYTTLNFGRGFSWEKLQVLTGALLIPIEFEIPASVILSPPLRVPEIILLYIL